MKIEEQVLSIEQMKHIQELGVDTSDASMCWVAGEDADEVEWNLIIPNNFLLPYNIPTYTIGELIEKLPKQIGWYELSICWENECIEYDNWISEEVTDYIGDFNFENRPIIEALYDCLCWVAENHKELLEVKK